MAHRHAQLVRVDAERVFTERCKSLLANGPNPRAWLFTVKTAVFGANSSLPPLVDRRGMLVWSADKKASMFSAQFGAKQCTDRFQRRILVILAVLLPSDPALFVVCLWIWFLMVKIILMMCSHFFIRRWLGSCHLS